MSTATHVEAHAVSTIEWLSADATTIVVPVYQRQYRWDIGGCEQLLADIRAAAAGGPSHRHFIGSILSAEESTHPGASLILIDGQQRITTLMLLVAALQHTVRSSNPELAAELGCVLVRADDPSRTKLRPHDAWADLYESVILDRPDRPESRFDDNYAFFRSQIDASDVDEIWAGLRRLEHVSITLGPKAHAQQIFESLNSTGEPLRDHELIHNYVLMGLSHAEQQQIEDDYWLPIERATGDAIGTFWRHFLVMTTGREITGATEHGVYAAFRQSFPRGSASQLESDAAHWRAHAELYAVLRDPSLESDAALREHFTHINTFGRATYPLVLRVYGDYRAGVRTRAEVIEVLEWVQALYLRRAIVGLPTERIIARLCRAYGRGHGDLLRAIARITPSDERIRAVLKYGELPHPRYVLGRLLGVSVDDELDVEHIAPLAPSERWSGDGVHTWRELSDDEQSALRALAPTLGNLTLLEPALAERVFGAGFVDKKAAYRRSGVAGTAAVASDPAWGTGAIAARTIALSDDLVRTWARPPFDDLDDDGLTPVLDAVRRHGWPAGWEREFDYVEYRGEHWEVKDVRALFNRVFRRAWTDDRAAALAYAERHGGPIYAARAWNGAWDDIGDGHHLYMGWDSNYMMGALQGVLLESGIAGEVFVKYSYIGNVM